MRIESPSSKGREDPQTIFSVFFELQKINNTIYEFGINHCVAELILDPTIAVQKFWLPLSRIFFPPELCAIEVIALILLTQGP